MIYKKAIRLGLRFETNKGLLNLEQLFKLGMDDLKTSIVELNEKISSTKVAGDELEFLGNTTSKSDEIDELKFAILKDVYITKKDELDSAKLEREKKLKRDKILKQLEANEETEFSNKSSDELKKMLEELS